MGRGHAQGQGASRSLRALPPEEGHPPFLLVADIGYQIDLYANFRGTGVYVPFPSALYNRLALNNKRKDDRAGTKFVHV